MASLLALAMLTVIARTRALADRWLVRAAVPVPAYSVAVFRILFGLLGLYGIVRFVSRGWVQTLYLEPSHHLTYQYFGWVQPWPPFWMYVHMGAIGLAALAIAVGFHSRIAAVVYFLGFGYLELIEGALYLNHYWWVTLAAAWMIVLPVHGTWSVDVWRKGNVDSAANTVPLVTVWILRAQLGVVYVSAGLAKINPDWMLDGNPLGLWLANRSAMPLVGSLLTSAGIGLVASWAGLLFDCTIVGWLSWSKTRPVAYVAVIVFHSVTGLLFQIGLFPLVMIAGTLVFFAPDWPLAVLARLTRRVRLPSAVPRRDAVADQRLAGWVAPALLLVILAQLAIPSRHFASPGNVRWTEEGYYLSWRVMLTEKTGVLQFEVTDSDTGEVWRVSPETVLTDWQARQASIRSDLLLAAAHLVAEDFHSRGYRAVEVRADSFVAINGRPRQRYIDQTVDLAELERGTPTNLWVLPMEDAQYD